jgi:COP9 signalosome complex subunit 7
MIPDTPSVASPGQQKLQPFLLLARSARGASSAVEVIKSALSAPGVLMFAELLQSPSIAALSADPTGAPWFRLASIFSYGTYSDYLGRS